MSCEMNARCPVRLLWVQSAYSLRYVNCCSPRARPKICKRQALICIWNKLQAAAEYDKDYKAIIPETRWTEA